MKKAPRTFLYGVLLAAVAVLCAVGLWSAEANQLRPAGESKAPAVELTFVFATGDETGHAAMSDMVTRFNAAQDEVVVKIQASGTGAYDELLKTLESVGEFPDILETTNTASYIRAGLLAELPEDIVSLFVNVVPFDGKVYTAPQTDNNTLGVLYNKDYFASHGLSEPATYEDFLALCETIAAAGDAAPLAVGAKDLWHIGFWFNKVYNDQVISQDPDFITHCYTGSKDFTDPTFKAVLTELAQIIRYAQADWVDTPDSRATESLLEGSAVMLYSGRHLLSQIEQQGAGARVGWFSVPSPDGKLRMVGGPAADGLAISSNAAKDPAKKEAAEKFLRFFFAKENYRYYCEALNILPTTIDAPEFHCSEAAQQVREDLAKADSIGPMWNSETGLKELPPDFRNVVYENVLSYLQGRIDLDTACDAINAAWRQSTRTFDPVLGMTRNGKELP